jgi:hypothetical protein
MPKTSEYGDLIWILRIHKQDLTDGEDPHGVCSDSELILNINKQIKKYEQREKVAERQIV